MWLNVLLLGIVLLKKFNLFIRDCSFDNLIFFLFVKYFNGVESYYIFFCGIEICILIVFIFGLRNIELVIGENVFFVLRVF